MFVCLYYSVNKCWKNTTLSLANRLRVSDLNVKCHLQYLIVWSSGRNAVVLLFSQQHMKECCELSDKWFDVLPISTSTAVTGNTQGCHTDTLSL